MRSFARVVPIAAAALVIALSPTANVAAAAQARYLAVTSHSIVTATQGWAHIYGYQQYQQQYRTAEWALVLQDTSSHLAALDVQIMVVLYGPNSTESTPTTVAITGIPAGHKYYLVSAGEIYASSITSIQTSISVGRTYTGRFVLPAVQMTVKQGRVVAQVNGTVNNPYSGTGALDLHGNLNVIYFGNAGQIVGTGTQTVVIPPPGKIDPFIMGIVPPAGTMSAKASVDPCYTTVNGLPAQCVALQ
jgi:opacity protein-like surface antigen